jgi:hypothetical protein
MTTTEAVKCDTCGRSIDDGYCSEFCAVVSAKELAAYKALKPGDYGVFPCSECGAPTEGDWLPGMHCGSCDDTVRSRRRKELLREALPHLPEGLAARVQYEIGST